jgi:hypothetical protein
MRAQGRRCDVARFYAHSRPIHRIDRGPYDDKSRADPRSGASGATSDHGSNDRSRHPRHDKSRGPRGDRHEAEHPQRGVRRREAGVHLVRDTGECSPKRRPGAFGRKSGLRACEHWGGDEGHAVDELSCPGRIPRREGEEKAAADGGSKSGEEDVLKCSARCVRGRRGDEHVGQEEEQGRFGQSPADREDVAFPTGKPRLRGSRGGDIGHGWPMHGNMLVFTIQ